MHFRELCVFLANTVNNAINTDTLFNHINTIPLQSTNLSTAHRASNRKMNRTVHKVVVVVLLAAGEVENLQNLLGLQHFSLLFLVFRKRCLDKRVCADVVPFDCQIKGTAHDLVNIMNSRCGYMFTFLPSHICSRLRLFQQEVIVVINSLCPN